MDSDEQPGSPSAASSCISAMDEEIFFLEVSFSHPHTSPWHLHHAQPFITPGSCPASGVLPAHLLHPLSGPPSSPEQSRWTSLVHKPGGQPHHPIQDYLLVVTEKVVGLDEIQHTGPPGRVHSKRPSPRGSLPARPPQPGQEGGGGVLPRPAQRALRPRRASTKESASSVWEGFVWSLGLRSLEVKRPPPATSCEHSTHFPRPPSSRPELGSVPLWAANSPGLSSHG